MANSTNVRPAPATGAGASYTPAAFLAPPDDGPPEEGHFTWQPADVEITPPAPNAAINRQIRRRMRRP